MPHNHSDVTVQMLIDTMIWRFFLLFFLASGIQPVMVSLRRSHTNVSDFTHGGRGVKGGGYCRPRVEPRYWNEGCELQTTGMTYALARSRSNIAALGLNPEAVYHRNPHQINQIPGKEFGTYNLFFDLGSCSLVSVSVRIIQPCIYTGLENQRKSA